MWHTRKKELFNLPGGQSYNSAREGFLQKYKEETHCPAKSQWCQEKDSNCDQKGNKIRLRDFPAAALKPHTAHPSGWVSVGTSGESNWASSSNSFPPSSPWGPSASSPDDARSLWTVLDPVWTLRSLWKLLHSFVLWSIFSNESHYAGGFLSLVSLLIVIALRYKVGYKWGYPHISTPHMYELFCIFRVKASLIDHISNPEYGIAPSDGICFIGGSFQFLFL